VCQRSEANPHASIQASGGRSGSEKTYRPCRPWLPGIVRCGVVATWVIAGTMLAWVPASTAAATFQPRANATTQPDNPLADLLRQPAAHRVPSPDEAMDSFVTIEGWVREWAEPAPSATTASAARVALFERGRLVGAASRLAELAGDAGVLSAAATDAMATAQRSLAPRPDALVTEQMRVLAAELTISVELAGPLTPLSEGDLANPDATLRPGLGGLAARVGDEWAVVFPSELVATGTPAGIRLPAMAAGLIGDPTLGIELPTDLARQHGVTFYRFEVVHVAGVGAGGSAAFLTRGSVVVETSTVTTPGLVRFAESLLGHFEATWIDDDRKLGLRGTIDAPRGVATPALASPMQQSLAALSLLNLADTPLVSADVRARARKLARKIMIDLHEVDPVEVAPADDGVATAMAWVVLWRLDAVNDDQLRPFFETCESMLAQHAAADRGETTANVAEAVLVWALAERARHTGKDQDIAARDLDALTSATRPGGLVGLMPWIGWAEVSLAGDGPIPSAAALRRVREQVWEHQLTFQDTGLADRDLAGGVVFTSGIASLPTWATARPTVFCATMLGDPRLTTPTDAPGEVVRLISAMRFLMQLAAREPGCKMYPRADLARGGVRAALWDPRMPPEATATTLLSVCEFLRALEAIKNAKNPALSAPTR
jgi:hypothetical protein